MISLLILADEVCVRVADAGDRALNAKWPVVVFAGLCSLPAIDVLVKAVVR